MHIPPTCLTCGDPTIGAVGPAFLAWRQDVMAKCVAAAGLTPSRAMSSARLRPGCQTTLLPDAASFTPARRVRTSNGPPDAPAVLPPVAERRADAFPQAAPLEPIFEALGVDSPCCRMHLASAIPLEYVL